MFYELLHMDTQVLADQQKNLHSSALCGYWKPSTGLAKSDDQ